MNSLPLFKFGSRAKSTSLGIALCTMFIVASFSVVGGLRNSMDVLRDNFTSEMQLITMPGGSGLGYFAPSDVTGIVDEVAWGVYFEAVAEPYGSEVGIFAVVDPEGVISGLPAAYGYNVLAGADSPMFGNITLSGVNISIAGRFSSSLFPSDWLLGSIGLLWTLSGQEERCNFAISSQPLGEERAALEASGFVVQDMIGIIPFLDSGVREIEDDAFWVLIPSVTAIAILAYSFLGSETYDRRHDIGILKTVGAGRRKILLYLIVNALVISAWGGLLGLALGIVLSYGVSTIASSMFTSVFVIKASEVLLASAFLATVGAGFVGALLPALRMTLSSPVEDLKEVMPFS